MEKPDPLAGGLATRVRRALIVAFAYALFGKLGLLLAIPPGYATAVWPASGVALAAALLWGRGVWPGILLGSFLVNISTSWDASSAASIAASVSLASAIGAGAALQAVVGAWAIRRFGRFRNVFTGEAEVIRMLVLGGPLACAVNASIGVTSLWIAGLVPRPNLLFNWWTWWVGDSIGVLIFTPLVCAWSLPRAQWSRQQIALSLPMAVIFAAVVALFFNVSATEQKRLSTEFEERADALAAGLQDAVQANLQMLSALRSFFAASEVVKREEFEVFVSHLLPQYPAVQAVGWAPRVEAAQLAAFEQAMREDGTAEYQVHDSDALGRKTAPAARDTYWPLAFILPRADNLSALGYDVTSHATRRDAVQRALAARAPAATSWVHLRQDAASRSSTLLYLPMYDAAGHTLGIASAVLRVEPLMQTAFAVPLAEGLHIHVFDGRDAQAPALTAGVAEPAPGRIASTRSILIRVADRQWIAEFQLPSDYLVANRSWQAWGLLAAGLSLAALLGMLLLVLLARQARVEEQVLSRTTALREAEQRVSGLLEAAPDGILIVDEQGRIELVNRQVEQLFGYPREELIGQPIDHLVPDRYRDAHAAHRANYARDLHARQMGAGLELHARRKDGSQFPVEISLGPRQIGTRRYVIAAVRDVSERTVVQRKLASYAADLERSNRELAQFASIASHDLQAPVRGVLSFVQLLDQRFRGKVLEGKALEFLGHIEASAVHMKALIDGLLALSRVGRQGAAPDTVECNAVLAEVEQQLAGIVQERDARITHDALPRVRGSRLEIFQLLQNLIVNGLKFQPGTAPRVHLSATRESEAMWRISVRDYGIGIAPQHQARIFRIFQRLHSAEYEGTGIGLAICEKIVSNHGGRIWVESAPGEGATFHFTLPAA